MATLLIVEDDALLLDALSGQLKQLDYSVCTASSVPQAMALLQMQAVDGIILDLGLPGADGIELLTWARAHIAGLPVLILTARDGVEDRVQGLNAGADDYLTKPFNMAELLARLQAMLRRSRLPAFGGSLEVQSSTSKNLRLDPVLPLGWLGEEAMELTHREWSLLSLLVNNMGQVVGREDVLAVWQTAPQEGGAAGSNALEVYVHRLRRKLNDSGLSIRNVRGLGYMLESDTP